MTFKKDQRFKIVGVAEDSNFFGLTGTVKGFCDQFLNTEGNVDYHARIVRFDNDDFRVITTAIMEEIQ